MSGSPGSRDLGRQGLCRPNALEGAPGGTGCPLEDMPRHQEGGLGVQEEWQSFCEVRGEQLRDSLVEGPWTLVLASAKTQAFLAPPAADISVLATTTEFHSPAGLAVVDPTHRANPACWKVGQWRAS